jgi:hypothetical protein
MLTPAEIKIIQDAINAGCQGDALAALVNAILAAKK